MGIKKFNDGLTEKQKRFVEYYEGDAVEASRLAGYGYGSNQNLMRNPAVIKAIKKRRVALNDPLIHSRNARLKWIADQINAEKHGIRNRLKAMEMMQKSCGDYLEPGQPLAPGQAPPTVIVIKPGKEATTNICIEAAKQAAGEGTEAILVSGEESPVDSGAVGDGLPDGDGTDRLEG